MNIVQPAAQSARTKDADGTGHTLRILKCAPCSWGCGCCGLWAWGRGYNIQMIFRVRCRTSQEAEVAGSREIWHVGRGVTRVMLSYTTPMQCSAMPFHWKPKFACLAKLFMTNMESFEESRDTCKCYNSRDTCHDECDESHAGGVVTGFSRANMSRPAPGSLSGTPD